MYAIVWGPRGPLLVVCVCVCVRCRQCAVPFTAFLVTTNQPQAAPSPSSTSYAATNPLCPSVFRSHVTPYACHHPGAHVGVNVSPGALHASADAVVLAAGATRPRDLPVEGRDLAGGKSPYMSAQLHTPPLSTSLMPLLPLVTHAPDFFVCLCVT